MRRSEREVTSPAAIKAIIDQCGVLHLALRTDGAPYVLPLSFGYRHDADGFAFYFHCAEEGRKLDLLREDPRVGFELDCPHELTTANPPCRNSLYYESVVGEGRACIVEDVQEKCEALRLLTLRQTGQEMVFHEAQVQRVTICRIDVTAISGKANLPG